MNTRDKIRALIREYQRALNGITDGKATIGEQDEIIKKLKEISFYTNRLMLCGNDELDEAKALEDGK